MIEQFAGAQSVHILRCTVSGGLEALAECEARQLLFQHTNDTDTHTNNTNHKIEIGWRERGHSGSQLEIRIHHETPSMNMNMNEHANRDRVTDIAVRVMQLRLVEYVYLDLVSNVPIAFDATSINKNNSNNDKKGDGDKDYRQSLLECIQSNAALISREAIDAAMHTCQECSKSLREVHPQQEQKHNPEQCPQVGLEELPGVLLPTPVVDYDTDDYKTFGHSAAAILKAQEESGSLASKPTHRDKKGQDDPINTRGKAANTVNEEIQEVQRRRFVVNTIYTKPQVARVVVQVFLDLVQTHSPELFLRNNNRDQRIIWLDAGAGSGSLLRHLPNNNTTKTNKDGDPTHTYTEYSHGNHTAVGIDTHPAAPSVHQMDFFGVTKEWLLGLSNNDTDNDDTNGQQRKKRLHVCVISNPPFSERSRGDYSAIVKFINHAIEQLDAIYIGVIVPAKFARERIWQSLGMHPNARLLARFILPTHSFYDPSSSISTRSARSGQGDVHIQSYFLFFRVLPPGSEDVDETKSFSCVKITTNDTKGHSDDGTNDNDDNEWDTKIENTGSRMIHVVGKRDKGSFPFITTAEFTHSVVTGLHFSGAAELGSEQQAKFIMCAKLKAAALAVGTRTSATKNAYPHIDTTAVLELSLLLNSKQPLSLANCVSRTICEHSLGWMSSSVKPPVAYAMCSLAISNYESFQDILTTASGTNTSTVLPIRNRSSSNPSRQRQPCGLIVNAMCGEGTIELESQDAGLLPGSCFMISGDKSASVVSDTAVRLASLKAAAAVDNTSCNSSDPGDGATKGRLQRSLLVDLVVWDAQRLPIRSEVVDAFLADLPIVGSSKKQHQEPCCVSGQALENSLLDYRRVMAQTVRVLKSGTGRAALLSADYKALSHAAGQFNGNWSTLWRNNLNLGGLISKLFVMEKHERCSKDLSVWTMTSFLPSSGTSITHLELILTRIAREACNGYYLNELLEMEKDGCENSGIDRGISTSPNTSASLVSRVEFRDSFFHKGRQLLSHCYRVWFDERLSNFQGKTLEKQIRAAIQENPPEGVSLR